MSRRILNAVRTCSCCGARMLLQGYDANQRIAHIMKQNTICYGCAYWQDIKAYPPQYMEIVGAKCIKVCPVADKKDKSLILGGKGKMRYFIRNDFSTFQSNDVWLIGVVPERFRKDFKPTAKEITAKVYARLQKNSKQCKARGCFDRYHCLRYNLELENDGAFNVVPLNWRAGDEHCKFFINIDTAFIDDSSVNNNKSSHG